MTVAELNGRRKEANLPLLRFDLRKLSADDIQDLRDAYAALYDISNTDPGDNRGYWAVARGHGYDEELCHNDGRIFLTWHRSYVYVFERMLSAALRATRGDENLWLTLPFWNWTLTDQATDAPNGIPRVLNDPTYEHPVSGTQPNPLFRALSMFRILSQGQTSDARFTTRDPSRFAAAIPTLAADIERNLDNPDFAAFSSDLNGGAHGTVHVRVGGNGGDMGQVVSAAYDPIFWLHHSMIDKVWFDWQTARPNAEIPQHVLDTPVFGGFVGNGVIDTERQLLYIFSDQAPETAAPVGGTVGDAEDPPAGDPPADDLPADEPPADEPPADEPPADEPPAGDGSGNGTSPEPAYLPIGPVVGPFKRAQLDFYQLRPPKQAYEVRAYLNNEGADASTPISDPSFGGRLVLFGHGGCYGAPGHCDPSQAKRGDYDKRRKHYLRYESTRYTIDCTRGLRRLVDGAGGPVDVAVTLVVMDAAGDPVPQDAILYRGVSLSTLT